MTTLLIATRNAHKVGEIRAILGAQFQFLTLNDFPAAPKVVEDADTFAGNAAKKAVELAKWLAPDNSKFKIQNSKPDFVLADDSGLEVDALNGAPGVHSARFAALDRSAATGVPPTTRPTPTTTPSCCACSRTFRRKNARRDSVASSRWWRVPEWKIEQSRRRSVTRMNLNREHLTAFAKAGLFSCRADKTALATIRCSCRSDTSRHSPNWAKT